MTVSLILLAILLTTGLLLYLHDRLSQSRHRDSSDTSPVFDTSPSSPGEDEEECCGMHITCEKDSLVAGIDPTLLYYDDEELDAFKGRAPQSYTPDESEQFREVLLTMRPDEIAGWARSLTTRGIALPTDVREELLLIVGEARKARSQEL
ncbi:MAG: hypothetical protein NC082_03585 [Clostridiales bacterium]|nr:hypothetical protein [Clostridiales bacterium]